VRANIATMFRGGYWLLGRWRGAPIKLHFSVVLCLILFSRFRWSPGFFVAYPCLLLAHELGHAVLVQRYGHRLAAVEVTGLGGVCHWSGNAAPLERAIIAWGGVLAQLGVFAATELWLWLLPPTGGFGWQMASAFTDTNLWLIGINLLPIPPLDGARAWSIFSAWRQRGPSNLPHGTWRDQSAQAQRAWFDKLRPRDRRGSSASEANPEGPLSPETQQAIDRLLKSVTGKERDSERGD
jgi:stage IV sporulation protein FB